MPRRPPKKWFYEMVERLKKEYPNYPPARIEKIAAGVWYKKYGPTTKAKVVSAEHQPLNPKTEHHSPSVWTWIKDYLNDEIEGLEKLDAFIDKIEQPSVKALLEKIRDQERGHVSILKAWVAGLEKSPSRDKL